MYIINLQLFKYFNTQFFFNVCFKGKHFNKFLHSASPNIKYKIQFNEKLEQLIEFVYLGNMHTKDGKIYENTLRHSNGDKNVGIMVKNEFVERTKMADLSSFKHLYSLPSYIELWAATDQHLKNK